MSNIRKVKAIINIIGHEDNTERRRMSGTERGREGQGGNRSWEEEISFSRKLATLTAHSRHLTSFSGHERCSGEAVINLL